MAACRQRQPIERAPQIGYAVRAGIAIIVQRNSGAIFRLQRLFRDDARASRLGAEARRAEHRGRSLPGSAGRVERVLQLAKSAVARQIANASEADAAQPATHGLAWLATYVEALRQMLGWATRLEATAASAEMERLLLVAALRRIPGADRRRHSHEPGRDRAPRGAGRAARRDRAASRTRSPT